MSFSPLFAVIVPAIRSPLGSGEGPVVETRTIGAISYAFDPLTQVAVRRSLVNEPFNRLA
jgi:hypothetical protein